MLAILSLLCAPAQAQSFADLAKTHALTASDEHKIGASAIKMSGWMFGSVEDEEMIRRVEGITRRVLAASDRPDLVINVTVVDDDDVNAAAFPGGYLIVNRGAVELFDDDELAFVVAHEISHVLLRHYATTQNLKMATEKLSVVTDAMRGSDRDAGRQAYEDMAHMMATYGRQLEFEADLYGLLYAARAGVPIEAAERAMKKLESVSPPVPPEYIDKMDHPPFEERIAELSAGNDTLLAVHRKFDLGLSSLSAGLDEPAIEAFEEFLTLFPRSSAGWTNHAAAQLRLGLAASDDPWVDGVPFRVRNDVTLRASGALHFDRAKDSCSKALAIQPDAPECWAMLGVIARHTEGPKAAELMFAKVEALEGDSPLLWVNRGVLRAMQDDFDGARDAFKKAQKLDRDTPHAKANLALIWEKKGKNDAAIEIWTELAENRQLSAHAEKALQRLKAPMVKAPEVEEVTLGGLKMGMSEDEFIAVLGRPDVEDEDSIGLTTYRAWSRRGVSAIFSAGGAMGIECTQRCRLRIKDVGVGSPWSQVASLGTPSEENDDALFGLDATAYFESLGVTVSGRGGRVARITVWAP